MDIADVESGVGTNFGKAAGGGDDIVDKVVGEREDGLGQRVSLGLELRNVRS